MIHINLSQYKSLVFDCDGVVFDSNKLRAKAFYNAALPYGVKYAEALEAYHILHGGVSRYVKFEVLLRDMLGLPVSKEAMDKLLLHFTTEVRTQQSKCKLAPGLQELRKLTAEANWLVTSGADQQELRVIFAERGIDGWFDGGIFGSPLNKDQLLAREIASGNCRLPAIFFGDSRYDHEAAIRAGLDFIFMSQWTDMDGWEDYCNANNVTTMVGFEQFL